MRTWILTCMFTIACVFLCKFEGMENQDFSLKYELETGELVNLQTYTCEACSNKQFVSGFNNKNNSIIINPIVDKTGKYELKLSYRIPSQADKKKVTITMNNIETYELTITNANNNKFKESVTRIVNLNAGENTIKITSNWGYFDLDYLQVSYPVKKKTFKLSNSKSSVETKKLMSFLNDNYKNKIISGQQNIERVNSIAAITGKKPAIVGFDFMDYSPSRVENGNYSNEVEKAIKWNKDGGIVTFSWHWNAPKNLTNWKRGFYTDGTTFDIKYALEHPDSEDYKLILRDIDQIAMQLEKLKENNVPVIFRPLHEAEGGWFWWGAKGPEAAKELYKLIYKRMTTKFNLNNIIWVWNSTSPDWYPGNQFVDIVSYDSYPPAYNYKSSIEQFDLMNDLVREEKLVTMSENGSIPNPAELQKDQAFWSWFLTWDSFISEKNSKKHIIDVYNSDYVITLDDLPNLQK